jgi:hypothetical protein
MTTVGLGASFMRGLILFPTLMFGLLGCVGSHSFYLMDRKTGASGSATVPANGQHGGPIAITLGSKTYKGQWVYMQTGGSISIGTTTAVSGARTATALGSSIGLPTGGNGNIVATAEDGSTLHCAFDFSELDLRGIGTCQDNEGEMYDLQIR